MLQTIRNRIFVVPPTIRYGNLGDEKVMLAIAQQLEADQLTIVDMYDGMWQSIAPSARTIALCSKRFLLMQQHARGIGKLLAHIGVIWSKCTNIPSLLRSLLSCEHMLLPGMDILDGNYGMHDVLRTVMLAHTANMLGARVTIMNCSFSRHPKKAAILLLRSLPQSVRLIAREPQSQQRMQQLLRRPISLSADVAFLMNADLHNQNSLQSHIDWIETQRTMGRHVIALNLADTTNAHCDALIDAAAHTIRTHTSIAFILIPHVIGKGAHAPNDTRPLQAVRTLLTPKENDRCTLITSLSDPRELQPILEKIDMGICGRMHLAIGLLAAEVPVACIDYQDKFEGLLADHCKMPELVLDVQHIIAQKTFADVIENILPRAQAYQKRLHDILPTIRSLARMNLDR